MPPDQLCVIAQQRHPCARLQAVQHGIASVSYTHLDDDEVFAEIAALQPDLVLVALGIPRQELAIHDHLAQFQKGIFIGVGGSFDVLSGSKKRAPTLFIKFNLEWLYRILKEPKRLKRFYDSNIRFLGMVKKLKAKGS